MLFSFLIELYLSPSEAFPRVALFITIFANQVLIVGMPIWVVLSTETNPIVAMSLLFAASIFSLKTLSFHHVWHDVRFYVREERRRTGKQKKRKLPWGADEWFAEEDSEADEDEHPQQPRENYKLYDLSEEVFQLGVETYPGNVELGHYAYFLMAPTLCYQVKYPRSDRCRPMFVLKRSLELAVTSVLMMFLIQQSVFPIARITVETDRSPLEIAEKVLRLQM